MRLDSTCERQVNTNNDIFNMIRQLPCVRRHLLASLQRIYTHKHVSSGIMYSLKCDKLGRAVGVEGDFWHIIFLLTSWMTCCGFSCQTAQQVAGALFPLAQKPNNKSLTTGQTSLRMFTDARDEAKCLQETLFGRKPTQQHSCRSCRWGGDERGCPVLQRPVPGLG